VASIGYIHHGESSCLKTRNGSSSMTDDNVLGSMSDIRPKYHQCESISKLCGHFHPC
jgi:hypothetical protein